MCHSWKCLDCAVLWPEAIHRVCWLWRLPGGTGQGQLLPVPDLVPPGVSYKAVCKWLLIVLGLEVTGRGQAANQGQLPLVLGLGPLSKKYRSHQDQMLLVWGLWAFERFYNLFFKKRFYLFIFRGRGKEKEREREKHLYERETLISCLSHTTQLGMEPKTKVCALMGTWTGDLLVCGTMPNQQSHTGQGTFERF